ncbi:hypothetical protein ACFTAO_38515 [Paenibacillus rhizoplanae]
MILFCIMAIPTAVLTWYSGSQIIQNSEAAIGESTLAGLNANRRLNENALANLAQDTSRLAATNIFLTASAASRPTMRLTPTITM